MEGRSAVSEGESGVGLARCVLAWLYQQLHGKSFEHGEGAFSISPMHAAHHYCGGGGGAGSKAWCADVYAQHAKG